jgi:CRISPR-associated protein Csb1
VSTTEVLGALEQAVGEPRGEAPRGASALRLRLRLQPAAGPGAKVMPPTYAGQRGPVYVEEERVFDGQRVGCISLDSVASQANRMEEALLEEVAAGRVQVPTVWVSQAEFGIHSALEFSHRVYDAWVEDALFDGTRFGDTDLWREMASARRSRLTPLITHSPTSIVLGAWASRAKNPQGSARLPRILASEIVAVDAVQGNRAAGRLDLHHVSAGVPVYEAREGRITLDPDQATKDRGKPKPFPGERPGNPSSAGYGNVTPGLAQHGGITMRYALQTATVSLPALRECGFPADGGQRQAQRDIAGRALLAALALRMLGLQVEHGYDLRSGCLLVPEEEPTVELLDRIGQTVARWPLADTDTGEVLAQALERAAPHGLEWGEGISLVASEPQLELLRQSLAQAPAEEV